MTQYYGNVYDDISDSGPWIECQVEETLVENETDEKYDGICKSVRDISLPQHNLAFFNSPGENMDDGTRIIARKDKKYLLQKTDTVFYAGIIIAAKETNSGEYLVLFDDGHVQYVTTGDIRLVCGSPGLKYVHKSSRLFYEYRKDKIQPEK